MCTTPVLLPGVLKTEPRPLEADHYLFAFGVIQKGARCVAHWSRVCCCCCVVTQCPVHSASLPPSVSLLSFSCGSHMKTWHLYSLLLAPSVGCVLPWPVTPELPVFFLCYSQERPTSVSNCHFLWLHWCYTIGNKTDHPLTCLTAEINRTYSTGSAVLLDYDLALALVLITCYKSRVL